MKSSYYATIGRPRLHMKDEVTGFSIDLQVPRELMVDIVRENAHWLILNGDEHERTQIKEIARDITRATHKT